MAITNNFTTFYLEGVVFIVDNDYNGRVILKQAINPETKAPWANETEALTWANAEAYENAKARAYPVDENDYEWNAETETWDLIPELQEEPSA